MKNNALKTCVSGAVGLALLGGVMYLSNQDVRDSIAQESQHAKLAIDPVQHTPQTQHGEDLSVAVNEHDQRYQGNEVTGPERKLIALSLKSYLDQTLYGPLPPSFKGATIPGIYLDQEGNLIQDKSAKEFIEFFISGAREEGTQTAIDRIKEYFDIALTEPAYSQANMLLDNYMDYRFRLDAVASRGEIITQENKLSALKEALLERQLLRRATLGEEVANTMFGDNEKYENYTVKVMETHQNDRLTNDQKNALYAKHEEDLPSHIKEKVRHDRKQRELEHQISLLQQQGGKEDEIFALREAFYGEKYAQTWAFMEDNSDDWQARVNTFNQEKATILASLVISDDYKKQQVNALKDQTFNKDEQLKLQWQALQ
ncbi:MAG: lipase secretion chaperone [Oleiphilus sp.]